MTKSEYLEQQRQNRIQRNPDGEWLGSIVRGEYKSNYDNSHLWKIRNDIAEELNPKIRLRQIQYAMNEFEQLPSF
jgi:hypothetical protein